MIKKLFVFFRPNKAHWTQRPGAEEKLQRAAEKRSRTFAQKRLHWTQRSQNKETVARVVGAMNAAKEREVS